MFELLITLVERVGIIVTIAFVLTRLRFFRKMFYQDQLNRQQNLTAIMFFAFFWDYWNIYRVECEYRQPAI